MYNLQQKAFQNVQQNDFAKILPFSELLKISDKRFFSLLNVT